MELRNCALAFSCAAVAAHALPAAHPLWAVWLLAGMALAAAPRLRMAALALVGLGWSAMHADDAMSRRVSPDCAEAVVAGRVVGLPAALASDGATLRLIEGQRFEFAAERASCDVHGLLRLSWYEGAHVRGGERWRLHVRLKPPRGVANPHGFDMERWFARHRLAGTGYVLSGARQAARGGVDAAREWLRDGLNAAGLANAGVVAALALGDAAAIPPPALELYRRTGTVHLLVISGLHVSVVTALGFFLGRAVGLLLGISARGAGIVTALLLAGGYVLAAGAGLPLVRAYAMASAAMLALAAGRMARPSAVFAYALALVLAVDPMAPLAPGFWLSFGAVAVLLGFFAPRPRPRSWLLSALFAQLAIAVAFLPITAALVGHIHPLGIPLNLVVVPVMTMLVVPLALAGTVLAATPPGNWLLLGADFGVSLVAEVLTFADHVAPLYVADPGWRLPWAVAAACACLLPLSRCAKGALAATAVGLLLAPTPPRAADFGEIDVTTLDVGQGTAVIVATAHHRLLYDAGPAFPTGGDTGERVVLPTLRGRGAASIDMLMLSHGDIDHMGGAAAVTGGIPVARTYAGEPIPGIAAEPCHAGMRWRWDGVDFRVLSPPPNHALTGNDASCVLLIETATRRVLLAGDIEKAMERRLTPPPVDLLLVPHHGSATSSTAAFVAATRPRFAIVTAGFANRFGHPHPAVVERYQDVGAHVLSTAVSGALRWNSARPDEIDAVRCRASPYWRRTPERDAGALSTALLACP